MRHSREDIDNSPKQETQQVPPNFVYIALSSSGFPVKYFYVLEDAIKFCGENMYSLKGMDIE